MKKVYEKFILWFASVFFAWFVALFISLGMRQRMSHNKGVAARGKLRIIDKPEFPENEFFRPGREFPCRIRHASVSFFDDAMMQVRGASLKFSDNRFKSPFDLEMNTGSISIFWTAANFLFFVFNRRQKGGIQYKDYYEKCPDGKKGAQVSGKYKPESFADLTFFSKNPLRFSDVNGNEYYVKYRLNPLSDTKDTGQVPAERLEAIYDQRVEEGEKLNVNYLVDEYKQRIGKKPTQYRLQLQLHKPSELDTNEIFNSFIDWDEDDHPWMDLAEISIDELLDYEETLKLGFQVNNYPPSLGHLPSHSIHDYNSIVYMRSKTPIAYKARMFSYKLFGIPPETAVDAPRNQ